MKTIYKYVLNVQDIQRLDIPRYSEKSLREIKRCLK